MYVLATFNHSPYLERVIIELEKTKMKKLNIVAVPLTETARSKTKGDPARTGDQVGLNFMFIFGMVFMLFGVIYGFLLTLGPILLGIIGLLLGGLIGYLIDSWLLNRYRPTDGEVILIVECEEQQSEAVELLLRDHHALRVGKL